MGIFNFEDPQTGKLYKFTISGDAPSNTEFGQITQILDRDRTQIDKKYESAFGEAPERSRFERFGLGPSPQSDRLAPPCLNDGRSEAGWI